MRYRKKVNSELLLTKSMVQVDQIWMALWPGPLPDQLSVIQQISYLLFIKRLDDLHMLEEAKAEALGIAMEHRIFPEGEDDHDRPYSDLRWSRFKHFDAQTMMDVVKDRVPPFLRELAEQGCRYCRHMSDTQFGLPSAEHLAMTVRRLDRIPTDDQETVGNLYEYMIGKIDAGRQRARLPRCDITRMMVALTAPTPDDVICDPAAGTCGFLVAAAEYLREHHAALFSDEKQRQHFHNSMFHGFDLDPIMLRIGAMNMFLHGIENADLSSRDILAEDHSADAGRYSLILTAVPIGGSRYCETPAKDLQRIVKTKSTTPLFIVLILRLLKTGGRAAVIVPISLLFDASKVGEEIRRTLVDDHNLDAVITLPSGAFRLYFNVSPAILVFTKTPVGETKNVWFYDIQAEDHAHDHMPTPLPPSEQLGPTLSEELTADDHNNNSLPDLISRWAERRTNETGRPHTVLSLCVSRDDIASSGSYDLTYFSHLTCCSPVRHFAPPFSPQNFKRILGR